MLERLLEHNLGYYAIIASRQKKWWGEVFVNPANPTHGDSNHGEIIRASPGQFEVIISQLEGYYIPQGITPTIYLNQFTPSGLVPFLEGRGYALTPAPYELMLWEKVAGSLPLRPGITVERVENHNRAEALAIISGERSWGTADALGLVFTQGYAHPHVDYWLARKDGTPAAAGFLFRQGSMGRIDSFRTLPHFRRQGLATALIQHIQQEFLRQGGTSLYLQTADPLAVKMYHACGFRSLGSIERIIARGTLTNRSG